MGDKALYACPDCGGGLWSVKEDAIKKYRCHIGHSYSEDDLLLKQSEHLEATFWVALRMMEERRTLLTKISDDENRRGLTRMGNIHRERASELEAHIEKLKELVYATRKD